MNAITAAARDVRRRRGALNTTRYLQAYGIAKGDILQVEQMVESRRLLILPEVKTLTRAAVAAGSTANGNWANPLIQQTSFAKDWVEYSNARSAFGKLTERFRRLPVLSTVPRVTAHVSAAWVGEGAPNPVGSAVMEPFVFPQPKKINSTLVVTKDLVQMSDVATVEFLTELMIAGAARAIDISVFDPTSPGTAERPASLTYGSPNQPSSGNIATDVKTLIGLIGTDLSDPVFVMRPRTAAGIGTIDHQMTRDISVTGGSLAGIPVVVTPNLPRITNSPAEDLIILVDCAEIFYSDDGLDVDSSREATVQLDTSPDSPPVASTVATSLFQADLVGLKILRFLQWSQRKPNATAFLHSVTY